MGAIYKILLIVDQKTSDELPKTIHELTKLSVASVISISWESGDDLKRLKHEIGHPQKTKVKSK